jgi:hypothetical protein
MLVAAFSLSATSPTSTSPLRAQEGAQTPTESAAAFDIAEPAETIGESIALPPLGALTARASEERFFEVPSVATNRTQLPSAVRNTFLLLDEETSGLPLDELLELRRLEAEAAAEAKLAAADSSDAEPDPAAVIAARHEALAKALAESIHVSAVLIAGDGGAAILNGEIVRVGGSDSQGRGTLATVRTDGVTIEIEGERYFLPLASEVPSKDAGIPEQNQR